MVRTEGQNILKFSHVLKFFKDVIFKCKSSLFEPLKQSHLKMKKIFELETLNPNNEILG